MTNPSARCAITSSYNASDGAAYHVFLGRWTGVLAERLVEFADFPDGPLLDIGCGTGSLTAAMGRYGPATGIDVALPYIAYAQARAGAEGSRFVGGAAERLPFRDGAFAGAAAQLVLNSVRDPLAAVQEMRRVTRQRGVIAACVWDFRGGLVFQRMFWDTAAGIDPNAGAARDRLFSGALALPDGLPTLFAQAPDGPRSLAASAWAVTAAV